MLFRSHPIKQQMWFMSSSVHIQLLYTYSTLYTVLVYLHEVISGVYMPALSSWLQACLLESWDTIIAEYHRDRPAYLTFAVHAPS